MKYRIFIFMVICTALLIAGCGNKEPFAPESKELDLNDQDAFLAKGPADKFTPYTATEKFKEELDPGKQWISDDNILHVRNRIRVYEIVSTEPRVAGLMTVSQDMNLDLNTYNGTLVSKCHHELEAMTGIWEGTLAGKLTNGILSGHGVAQGSGGDLEGLILKLWLLDTGPPYLEIPESGYIIEKQ
ncbi:MAG: hypothetical protein JSW07_14035 [bacterium]|nr:MAG: hypothetical protein JSW07_14035 [bacterium]